MPKARNAAKHRAPAIVRPPYQGSVRRDEIRNAIANTEVEASHEAIAQLAYSLWVARGCRGGSVEEDWLRAEEELRQRDPKPAS
jgi:exonuclease VII large subunit